MAWFQQASMWFVIIFFSFLPRAIFLIPLYMLKFSFFKVLLSNNSFKIPTFQIHSFILSILFIYFFICLFIYLLFYLRIYIYMYPFQNNLVKCDFLNLFHETSDLISNFPELQYCLFIYLFIRLLLFFKF